MKQYVVYYSDGGTEYIEAYSCTFKHGVAEFDEGNRHKRVIRNVRSVEVVS